MRIRASYLIGVVLAGSVLGLALILVVLFGADPTPMIDALPLTRPQRDALVALVPSEPYAWPWHRGGLLAAVTVLPSGADREQPELLPRITRIGVGSKASVQTEGAGFFISVDGTILTAAHLLKSCPTIRVTSRYLPSVVAQRVGVDTDVDLAMIRVTTIPPGILGLAAPPVGYARLSVLGYPADGEQTPVSEMRGTPWYDVDSSQPENPLQVLRIDAERVGPGFSGGPILSPEGDVIGLVRGAIVVRSAAHPDTPTPTGIVVGVGSGAIATFVGRLAPTLRMVDVKARHSRGEDAQETARRSVVRVMCGR